MFPTPDCFVIYYGLTLIKMQLDGLKVKEGFHLFLAQVIAQTFLEKHELELDPGLNFHYDLYSSKIRKPSKYMNF